MWEDRPSGLGLCDPQERPRCTAVQIPWTSLSPATLRAVVEEFITREGTDYGEHETPLSHKVDTVMEQLKHGSVAIFFDEETETVTLQPVDRRGRPRR